MFSTKQLYRGSFGTHIDLAHKCLDRKTRDAKLDVLEQTPWLTSLDLKCNQLKKNGAIWVHNVLQANPQLKHLFLNGNDLKEDGLTELSDSLSSLDVSLETLALDNNKLTLKSIGALVKIIHTSKQLRILSASFNDFEPAGALCLSAVLSQHSNLTALCLHCTKLGDEGISTICDYAETSRTLIMLDIGQNLASSVGIARITKMIASPSVALQHLKMKSNRITAGTSQAFGEAIANNHTLLRLQVRDCFDVAEFASQDFLEGLLKNDTLQRVSMACSLFNERAAMLLCQLLRSNPRLITFKLHGSTYDEAWIPPLLRSLSMNKTLVKFYMPCALTNHIDCTPNLVHMILKQRTLNYILFGYRYRPMDRDQEQVLNNRVSAALEFNGNIQSIRDFSGTLHTKEHPHLERNKRNHQLRIITFTQLLLTNTSTQATAASKRQRMQ